MSILQKMKYIKNTTITELKKDYSDRNGFVFKAAADCDTRNCERAAQGIKNQGYTEEMPEFIGEIDKRTFAFVYPEGVSFDTPSFLQLCQHYSFITKAFQVEPLCAWLKNQ